MAGDVFDTELPQFEEFRHRKRLAAVKLLRVPDQVLPEPEFVVALDPGDSGVRQDTPKRDENFLSDFDFPEEALAAARGKVEALNLPEVLVACLPKTPAI